MKCFSYILQCSRLLVCSCIFIVCGLPLSAQGWNGFQNDFCVPHKLYVLSDTINRIFTEPMLKRWRPYQEVMRFSGDVVFSRRIPREAVISKQDKPASLILDLYSVADFHVLKSDTAQICVGHRSIGKGEVKVQIVGDSYVDGGFFRDALLNKGYVPGIRLVGLRKVHQTDRQFDEGRGGWTVSNYFEIPKEADRAYHGFMQPADGHRYWGSCGFWKNAWKVKKGEVKDFEMKYSCGRFDVHLSKFDSETGYLLRPEKGDLMYDNDSSTYKLFTGRKWKSVEVDESTWRFDYGKYLSMWNVDRPEIMAVLLGLNDYRDSLRADYTRWNARMEEMKASYRKAVPQGKFVILMPCSTCGSLNNWRGDFTWRQNAAMWELRKNIIRTFDRRESEGFYIVDIALAVDSEQGYRHDKDGLQTGNPHPYLSYPDMSVPLAAFIQHFRQ